MEEYCLSSSANIVNSRFQYYNKWQWHVGCSPRCRANVQQNCNTSTNLQLKPDLHFHRKFRKSFYARMNPRQCQCGSTTQNVPIQLTKSQIQSVLDGLLYETERLMTSNGLNVVAFSGGVDSSLVAYLVNAVTKANQGDSPNKQSNKTHINGGIHNETLVSAKHNDLVLEQGQSIDAHGLIDAQAVACIAVSPSLPSVQLDRARFIAEQIGTRLIEITTNEYEQALYQANDGAACYACKTTLYSTITQIHQHLQRHHHEHYTNHEQPNISPQLSPAGSFQSTVRMSTQTMENSATTALSQESSVHIHAPQITDPRERGSQQLKTDEKSTNGDTRSDSLTSESIPLSQQDPESRRSNISASTSGSAEGGTSSTNNIVIFNGTNADDLSDSTRVGIVAATEFNVASPIAGISKAVVRQVAKHVGLSCWDWAASPCLRSRLELGKEATPHALHLVEQCEEVVRNTLDLPSTCNMRVRLRSSGDAVVEIDKQYAGDAVVRWDDLRQGVAQAGVQLSDIKLFKSGGYSQFLK